MSARRKEDTSTSRPRFRTDRFYQEAGCWHFITREQTQEGPFELREDAEEYLKRYINVMNSGWISESSELSLLPLSDM
jgi:Domain of unknown function (DUF6316)